MTDMALEIIRKQELLASDRSTWEAHWREIAELVLPRQDNFNERRTPGEKRTQLIYDGTAPLALERFAAAVEGLVTPRAQKWHSLSTDIEELNDDPEVKRYFDEVTKILFAVRYSARSSFAAQQHETYMSLGAFGTGAMFIDEVLGKSIYYKSIHLNELFFEENFQGNIDLVYRKFELTAKQAVEKFGNKLPDEIKDKAEFQPNKKFEFIHCVMPNEEKDEKRDDYRGMDFLSFYVSMQGKQIVKVGGYRTFPYAISRYVTAPREKYGRSPAMTVLSDIKMLNEMEKTQIRALHKMVDPPLLARDDGVARRFSTRPNAINFGGLDAQARQALVPLNTNARPDLNEAKMDQKRTQINDAFLVTLFQILVDSPAMTATEVLQRAQEKGVLLSPIMGRIQSEALNPMIEREIDILQQNGILPPLPQPLIDIDGEYQIKYDSPLSRAQRAEEAQGILRTVEAVTPFAQIDPTVLDVFNVEEITRIIAEVNGMPNKALRTPEELQELAGQRDQQKQLESAINAAPQVTQALKTVNDIQQTA